MAIDTAVTGLTPETPGNKAAVFFARGAETAWQLQDKTLNSTPPHVVILWANNVRSADGMIVRLRLDHSNVKKLGGTTKVEGVAARRTVRVYRRSDGMFIKDTVSRPDGTYDLGGFVPGESYVLTCLDDVAPLDYNDIQFAQVTPVDTVVEDANFGKDGPT